VGNDACGDEYVQVPPTLPAIVEAAIKLQNKRNQTVREVMKKKA
jgi:hypothetical protein